MTNKEYRRFLRNIQESARAPLLSIIERQNRELVRLNAIVQQLVKDHGIDNIDEMLHSKPKGKYIPIGRDSAYDFLEGRNV